jgi:hypothetical protein
MGCAVAIRAIVFQGHDGNSRKFLRIALNGFACASTTYAGDQADGARQERLD